MDRNLLTAIVLTTLVFLFFYSPFYQNRFGKPDTATAVEQTTATATSPDSAKHSADSAVTAQAALNVAQDTTATAAPAAQATDTTATPALQVNPPAERLAFLDNADVHLVIDTRGGVITNAVMKRYTGVSKDSLVQLVSPGQTWYDGAVTDANGTIPFRDIVFTATESAGKVILDASLADGRTIRKEFSISKDGYMLQANTVLGGIWNDPKITASFHGPLNKTEPSYRQLRIWPFTMFMQDENHMYDELVFIGEGDRLLDGKDKAKRVYTKDGGQRIRAKDSKTRGESFHGSLTWYSVRNKYFMLAAIPQETGKWTTDAKSSMSVDGRWYDFTLEKKVSDGSMDLSLYIGPTQYRELKAYGHDLTQSMDLSWKILRPLAILFIWFFRALHGFISNWGIVLIIFSVVVKFGLYPLSKSSMDSMKKVAALQPKINALREKYKNDPQKLQQETMELYRRDKVNPFGGCLPMLLQLPVFFALYPVIGRAFELRQAMFIPHWINDLSRPDPYYILPIAMGISTYLQSKSTITDPNQKMMLYIMPVMMVILFANFSAGLTLYWFMFNILTWAQQLLTNRTAAVTPAPAKA